MGSQYVYESSLLSTSQKTLALNKLSSGERWLKNYFDNLKEHGNNNHVDRVTTEDAREIALAILNLEGATACSIFLTSWTPSTFIYETTLLLSERLTDLKRIDALRKIACTKKSGLYLLLAIQQALNQRHQCLPSESLNQLFKQLIKLKKPLSDPNSYKCTSEVDFLAAVISAVIVFAKHGIGSHLDWSTLLSLHLPTTPPRSLYEDYHRNRLSLLRAYALHALLVGYDPGLIDLADAELKIALGKNTNGNSDSQNVRRHKEIIGALLPWCKVWAAAQLEVFSAHTLTEKIAQTKQTSSNTGAFSYRQDSTYKNEIARLWIDLLLHSASTDQSHTTDFQAWLSAQANNIHTVTLTYVVKASSYSDKDALLELAQTCATSAAVILAKCREDAQATIDSYLLLSRAMYAISPDDASIYFERAIACAEKIGGEHLERFNAVLILGKAAQNVKKPNPKLAYELARAAHLNYDFVVRDKDFCWDSLVETIAGLCPASAVAILSRWRDREFGYEKRLLSVLVSWLVKEKLLKPDAVPPLLGFQYEWTWDEITEQAICAAASVSITDKQAVWAHIYRYLKHCHVDSRTLKSIQKSIISNDLPVEALNQLLSYRLAQESTKHDAYDDSDDATPVKRKIKADTTHNWDVILQGLDFAIPSTLSKAYSNFKEAPPPWSPELFFNAVIKKINVRSRVALIKVVFETKQFSLYDFRSFLECLTADWSNSSSAAAALNDGVKTALKNHCLTYSIDHHSWYGDRSFEQLAMQKTGITLRDISIVTIQSLSERKDFFDTNCLYNMVGLLAHLLSSEQAAQALAYSLDLYSPQVSADDADGVWGEHLMPPPSIEKALAGYIWAGLARPSVGDRWEAAHVARGTFELKQTNIINGLLAFAMGEKATAFYDSKYHFYGLHAQQ